MIIVLVKYFCKKGCRAKFLDSIKSDSIDTLSRNETGNIKYEYSFDTENPDVLVLNEIWKDIEAVKSHGKEAHFKKLGDIKSEFVEKVEIQRFYAEEFTM